MSLGDGVRADAPARLVAAVETSFGTDFAMIVALQDDVDAPVAGSFVGTCPGGIAALAGAKYADVVVRVERWDARPPAQGGWEDCDELPFAEVPGAGPLHVGGFELGEVGVDVTGLGRARVVVYARGRHRYPGYDAPGDGQSEQWLLQLFPDPEGADALAGGPRRLAGPYPLGGAPRTRWDRAVHAWRTSGWSVWLHSDPGFHPLALALSVAGHPVSREELARGALTYMSQGYRRAPEAGAVGGGPAGESVEEALAVPLPVTGGSDHLAQITGTSVATLGQAVDALVDLGLLVQVDTRLGSGLVPHPCPAPVWQVLDLEEAQVRLVRRDAAGSDARVLAQDLLNQLAWAQGGHLETTLGALAVRNGAAREVLVEALDLLPLLREVDVDIAGADGAEAHPRADYPPEGHTRVSITTS